MIVGRAALRRVAEALGSLGTPVVFVGGAVLDLVIVEKVGPPPRPTRDVDVVVDVSTTLAYHRFEELLRERRFAPDTEEGAPICRYVLDGEIKVDVMPSEPQSPGFSSRWCRAALDHAEPRALGEGVEILVPSRPVFLAMKAEAFAGRGAGDFAASHDIEDFIAVVDGTPRVVREVDRAPAEVREYVARIVATWLSGRRFPDAVPGHLPGDRASQDRLPLVMERLRAIAALPSRAACAPPAGRAD
jgi:hypothetical protein